MEPEPPRTSTPRLSFELSVWLLGGFALALRLFDLDRRELWVDEGASWRFAEMLGHFELGEHLQLEPTPPLYYGLIGLLLRLGGDSDWILRLPSALGGALAIPLVALLGARLQLPRAGLAAGLFLALHPWHLFISREARVYPILATLVLALALVLWRALESSEGGARPWRDWLVVGVLLVLTFYSHLFGIFVGAAVAFVVLLLAPDQRTRLRGLVTVGAACLLLFPFLVIAGPSLAQSGAGWYQELFYHALPEESSLARIYEGQLIGARYHLLQRELARPESPPLLRWPAILAQSALLLAALFWLGRPPGPGRRALIFVGSFYLLPFLLPWAAGIVTGRALLQPGRHDFMILGSLALLIGAGFEAIRQRYPRLAVVLLLPIVLGATFRLAWIHLLPISNSARDRGRFLAEEARPSDLAVCFGIERLLAERYTRRAEGEREGGNSRLEFVSFPAETDDHPGWSDPRPLLKNLPALELEARQRLERWRQEGRTRLFTVERPWNSAQSPLPDRAIDEIWLRVLQNSGWRLEESRPDLHVRIWSLP